MKRMILSGCNGRMGQVIVGIVAEHPGLEIVCGFDVNNEAKNSFPVFACPDDFKGEADVIVDFSHPACLEGLLSFATKRNVPIVIATTGLSKQQIMELDETAKKIPVFFSANMSLGINLLLELAAKATRVLQDSFDIEIIEKHHSQKIDAPSGTALILADAIAAEWDQVPEYVYDRHSVRKKRDAKEIGIHSVRGGTIVGEHTVIFAGLDEEVELTHRATSREVFAIGAVSAAKYLCGCTPGLYSMQDLVQSL